MKRKVQLLFEGLAANNDYRVNIKMTVNDENNHLHYLRRLRSNFNSKSHPARPDWSLRQCPTNLVIVMLTMMMLVVV